MEPGQDDESLVEQKGWAEGGWLTCDHCVTQGFRCKVSDIFLCF